MKLALPGNALHCGAGLAGSAPMKKKGMKHHRLRRGLTVAQLAIEAGCDAATIYRHERNGTWPQQPRVLRGIIAALRDAPA
jgi:hypothetical protein